ncbi:hypothetical protein B4Q13_23145, partial [Lacticaseibacillus rhamnosus]
MPATLFSWRKRVARSVLLLAALAGCSAATAAAGDPAHGEQLYVARCGACHSIDDNGAGPRHRGLMGRRAATQPGFEYSDALKESKIVWDAKNLDVAAELARRLHLNLSYGIEFEELSQEHGHPAYIGQATLSRIPIRKSRILRFQTQSDFWKPHSWIPSSIPLMQRRLGNRIALVTEL